MQLRVPKKYKPRRRRSILPWRFLVRLVFLLLLAGGVYWLVNNPQEARERAVSAASRVSGELTDRRSQFFPPEPTPTPDVRNETIDCENAYLLGDYEDAIDYCKVAITGRPNDVDLHFRLAHMMVITSDGGTNVQRLEEALEVAQKTINADPESALGWAIAAMANDWAQNWNAALAYAERAQEINPDLPFTKAVMANIYRNLGQYDRAQASLNEALEDLQASGSRDPFTIAQVYRNLGRLQVSLASYEEAVEPYTIAYEAMPNHTYIAVELASWVYYSLDQYSAAIALLQQVRDSHPRDPTVLYWLSASYAQRGETEEQIQLLTVCVDANPDYIPCLSTLGQLQFWSQNYIQAINNLDRATDLGSRDPYDWFLLARSYYNIQRCEDAIEPIRQGYEIRKEVESAQVGLDDFIRAGKDCRPDLVLQ